MRRNQICATRLLRAGEVNIIACALWLARRALIWIFAFPLILEHLAGLRINLRHPASDLGLSCAKAGRRIRSRISRSGSHKRADSRLSRADPKLDKAACRS